MTHEEYKEMLTAHALGALDAGETRALEDHLSTCAACRTELAEWQDTTAAFVYSTPSIEPPPALRSSLLASIRAAKAETLSSSEAKRRRDSVADAAGQISPAATNVIALPERTRTRWNVAQKFGALAASLFFAAVVIALVMLWSRNQAMQAELARSNRDLQATQEQLRHEQEKSSMFASPETKVATLTGTPMAPDAHARLAYNNQGSAMLIADKLPPAPAGKDYQIWFIADGKPMPGGVFKPDAAGHVEMQDRIPAAARGAAAFAITLEPQGGTSAPTGEKYLLSAASS
jgi:anti-sigma-K factor RskA